MEYHLSLGEASPYQVQTDYRTVLVKRVNGIQLTNHYLILVLQQNITFEMQSLGPTETQN